MFKQVILGVILLIIFALPAFAELCISNQADTYGQCLSSAPGGDQSKCSLYDAQASCSDVFGCCVESDGAFCTSSTRGDSCNWLLADGSLNFFIGTSCSDVASVTPACTIGCCKASATGPVLYQSTTQAQCDASNGYWDATCTSGVKQTVTLTIQTAGGQSIPNSVVLSSSGESFVDGQDLNQQNGVLQFRHSQGTYTFTVYAEGYQSKQVVIAITQDVSQTITLDSGQLMVSPQFIVKFGSQNVEGVQISCTQGGQSCGSAVTNQDGAAELFLSSSAQSRTLTFSKSGYVTQTITRTYQSQPPLETIQLVQGQSACSVDSDCGNGKCLDGLCTTSCETYYGENHCVSQAVCTASGSSRDTSLSCSNAAEVCCIVAPDIPSCENGLVSEQCFCGNNLVNPSNQYCCDGSLSATSCNAIESVRIFGKLRAESGVYVANTNIKLTGYDSLGNVVGLTLETVSGGSSFDVEGSAYDGPGGFVFEGFPVNRVDLSRVILEPKTQADPLRPVGVVFDYNPSERRISWNGGSDVSTSQDPDFKLGTLTLGALPGFDCKQPVDFISSSGISIELFSSGKPYLLTRWLTDCKEEIDQIFVTRILTSTNERETIQYTSDMIINGAPNQNSPTGIYASLGGISFFDSDTKWDSTYKYEIQVLGAGVNALGTSPEKYTGDAICQYAPFGSSFSVCADELGSSLILKAGGDIYSCDANNLANPTQDICGVGTTCINRPQGEYLNYECALSSCEMLVDSSGGIFGELNFFNILGLNAYPQLEQYETCEQTLDEFGEIVPKACYSDYQLRSEFPFLSRVTDSCNSCVQATKCSDYKSQYACSANQCGLGGFSDGAFGCSWIEDPSVDALGGGYCVGPEEQAGSCEICDGPSCTQDLCSQFGECGTLREEKLPLNQQGDDTTTCEDCNTLLSLATTSGLGCGLFPQDNCNENSCGVEGCSWNSQSNICEKAACNDLSSSYLGSPTQAATQLCRSDLYAPTTSLAFEKSTYSIATHSVPSGILSTNTAAKFTLATDISDSNTEILNSQPQFKLSYCFEISGGSFCQDETNWITKTIVASSTTLVNNRLNLEVDVLAEFYDQFRQNDAFVSNAQGIAYFKSSDQNFNIEEARSQTFPVDLQGPKATFEETNGLPYEVVYNQATKKSELNVSYTLSESAVECREVITNLFKQTKLVDRKGIRDAVTTYSFGSLNVPDGLYSVSVICHDGNGNQVNSQISALVDINQNIQYNSIKLTQAGTTQTIKEAGFRAKNDFLNFRATTSATRFNPGECSYRVDATQEIIPTTSVGATPYELVSAQYDPSNLLNHNGVSLVTYSCSHTENGVVVEDEAEFYLVIDSFAPKYNVTILSELVGFNGNPINQSTRIISPKDALVFSCMDVLQRINLGEGLEANYPKEAGGCTLTYALAGESFKTLPKSLHVTNSQNIQIKAKDSIGNEETHTYSFSVDTYAPNLYDVYSSPTNYYYQNPTAITLSGRAEDDFSLKRVWAVRINKTSPTSVISPFDTSSYVVEEICSDDCGTTKQFSVQIPLGLGVNTIVLYAEDYVGNLVSTTPSQIPPYYVDQIPPDVLSPLRFRNLNSRGPVPFVDTQGIIVLEKLNNYSVEVDVSDLNFTQVISEVSLELLEGPTLGSTYLFAIGSNTFRGELKGFYQRGDYLLRLSAKDGAGNVRVKEYPARFEDHSPPVVLSSSILDCEERENCQLHDGVYTLGRGLHTLEIVFDEPIEAEYSTFERRDNQQRDYILNPTFHSTSGNTAQYVFAIEDPAQTNINSRLIFNGIRSEGSTALINYEFGFIKDLNAPLSVTIFEPKNFFFAPSQVTFKGFAKGAKYLEISKPSGKQTLEFADNYLLGTLELSATGVELTNQNTQIRIPGNLMSTSSLQYKALLSNSSKYLSIGGHPNNVQYTFSGSLQSSYWNINLANPIDNLSITNGKILFEIWENEEVQGLFEFSDSDLAEGKYEYFFSPIDSVNNKALAVNRTFFVDSSDPLIAILPPAQGRSDLSKGIHITYLDQYDLAGTPSINEESMKLSISNGEDVYVAENFSLGIARNVRVNGVSSSLLPVRNIVSLGYDVYVDKSLLLQAGFITEATPAQCEVGVATTPLSITASVLDLAGREKQVQDYNFIYDPCAYEATIALGSLVEGRQVNRNLELPIYPDQSIIDHYYVKAGQDVSFDVSYAHFLSGFYVNLSKASVGNTLGEITQISPNSYRVVFSNLIDGEDYNVNFTSFYQNIASGEQSEENYHVVMAHVDSGIPVINSVQVLPQKIGSERNEVAITLDYTDRKGSRLNSSGLYFARLDALTLPSTPSFTNIKQRDQATLFLKPTFKAKLNTTDISVLSVYVEDKAGNSLTYDLHGSLVFDLIKPEVNALINNVKNSRVFGVTNTLQLSCSCNDASGCESLKYGVASLTSQHYRNQAEYDSTIKSLVKSAATKVYSGSTSEQKIVQLGYEQAYALGCVGVDGAGNTQIDYATILIDNNGVAILPEDHPQGYSYFIDNAFYTKYDANQARLYYLTDYPATCNAKTTITPSFVQGSTSTNGVVHDASVDSAGLLPTNYAHIWCVDNEILTSSNATYPVYYNNLPLSDLVVSISNDYYTGFDIASTFEIRASSSFRLSCSYEFRNSQGGIIGTYEDSNYATPQITHYSDLGFSLPSTQNPELVNVLVTCLNPYGNSAQETVSFTYEGSPELQMVILSPENGSFYGASAPVLRVETNVPGSAASCSYVLSEETTPPTQGTLYTLLASPQESPYVLESVYQTTLNQVQTSDNRYLARVVCSIYDQQIEESVYFYVDTIPPEDPTISISPLGTNDRNEIVTITFEENDFKNGEVHVKISGAVTSSKIFAAPSSNTLSFPLREVLRESLAKGEYPLTFSVDVYDVAHNGPGRSNSVAFRYDTLAPTLLEPFNQNGYFIDGRDYFFNSGLGTTTLSGGISESPASVKRVDESYFPTSGSVFSISSSFMPDVFEPTLLQAKDSFGNEGDEVYIGRVYYDTLAPTYLTGVVPKNNDPTRVILPRLLGLNLVYEDASAFPTSNAIRVVSAKENDVDVPLVFSQNLQGKNASFSSTYDFSREDISEFVLELEAVDFFENSRIDTYAFTIDPLAPLIIIEKPAGITNDQEVRFSVNHDKAISSSQVLVNGNLIGSPSCNANVCTIQATFEEGENTIEVEVTDSDGRVGRNLKTFVYDSLDPIINEISIPQERSGKVSDRNISLDISFSELHPSILRVSGDVANVVSENFLQGSRHFFDSIVLSAGEGNKNIIVTLVDKAGNEHSLTYSVEFDATRPELENIQVTPGIYRNTWRTNSESVIISGSIVSNEPAKVFGEDGSEAVYPTPATFSINRSLIVSPYEELDNYVDLFVDDGIYYEKNTIQIITDRLGPLPPSVYVDGLEIIGSSSDGGKKTYLGEINTTFPRIILNYAEPISLAAKLSSSRGNHSIQVSGSSNSYVVEPTFALSEGDYILTLNSQDEFGNLAISQVYFSVNVPYFSISIKNPRFGYTNKEVVDLTFETSRVGVCRYTRTGEGRENRNFTSGMSDLASSNGIIHTQAGYSVTDTFLGSVTGVRVACNDTTVPPYNITQRTFSIIKDLEPLVIDVSLPDVEAPTGEMIVNSNKAAVCRYNVTDVISSRYFAQSNPSVESTYRTTLTQILVVGSDLKDNSTNVVNVFCEDKAGNTASATKSVFVDSTSSFAVRILEPLAGSYTSKNPVPIRVQTTTESSCVYDLDGVRISGTTNGRTHTTSQNMNEGKHTLAVSCLNPNDEVNKANSTFVVDRSAPVIDELLLDPEFEVEDGVIYTDDEVNYIVVMRDNLSGIYGVNVSVSEDLDEDYLDYVFDTGIEEVEISSSNLESCLRSADDDFDEREECYDELLLSNSDRDDIEECLEDALDNDDISSSEARDCVDEIDVDNRTIYKAQGRIRESLDNESYVLIAVAENKAGLKSSEETLFFEVDPSRAPKDDDSDGDMCRDGKTNGDETDTDCGGDCRACVAGEKCEVNSDCTSNVCDGGICQANQCSNGRINVGESDVDCGGICLDQAIPRRCAVGDSCVVDDDCSSGSCDLGICSPQTQDRDGDGIIDSEDNCPGTSNPDQTDIDGDSDGDVCDSDIDGDGLPNSWEITYFGNALSANPGDDLDGDGLTNLEEYRLGTDPQNPDTDGDGLLDGEDPEPLTPKSGGGLWIWILIILLILVALGVGGYYAYAKFYAPASSPARTSTPKQLPPLSPLPSSKPRISANDERKKHIQELMQKNAGNPVEKKKQPDYLVVGDEPLEEHDAFSRLRKLRKELEEVGKNETPFEKLRRLKHE